MHEDVVPHCESKMRIKVSHKLDQSQCDLINVLKKKWGERGHPFLTTVLHLMTSEVPLVL